MLFVKLSRRKPVTQNMCLPSGECEVLCGACVATYLESDGCLNVFFLPVDSIVGKQMMTVKSH